MKTKLLSILPYAAVAFIVIYSAFKYDAKHKQQATVRAQEQVAQERELLYSFTADFEAGEKLNFVPSEAIKFAGNSAAIVAKEGIYGPTFSCDSLALLNKVKRVEVSLMLYVEAPNKDATIVLSFDNETRNLIYKSAGMMDGFKANEWVHVKSKFEINAETFEHEKKLIFKAYTMNSGGDKFFIDNFEVKLFSTK